MRDFKKSEFSKTIGIKPENLSLIEKIKGKKSRAGKLNEIIEFYIEKHKLEKYTLKPCDKCFGNNWSFRKLDDSSVRATCESCGNYIEWKQKLSKQLNKSEPVVKVEPIVNVEPLEKDDPNVWTVKRL